MRREMNPSRVHQQRTLHVFMRDYENANDFNARPYSLSRGYREPSLLPRSADYGALPSNRNTPHQAAMDAALAISPNKVQIAARERTQPGKVTGKLRTACDAMVFEGRPYDEAARSVDMTVAAMRKALAKPHVQAYLRVQREVLRTSLCGGNILALAYVRDQTDNQMARVQAVKALEQIGEEQARTASPSTPGLVVVINTGPQAQDANNVGVTWSSDRKGE